MLGLFSRLRPRLEAPDAAPDEGRMSLAEIEALLREIAVHRPSDDALAEVEQSRSRRAVDAVEVTLKRMS